MFKDSSVSSLRLTSSKTNILMSKPQWKIEREQREERERQKKEEEERKKKANMAELEERKKILEAERKKVDEEDEKKIQELLEERKRTGILDTKEEAISKTQKLLASLDVLCTACQESVVDSTPFVRLGEEKKPYHRACLVCSFCNEKKPGIQLVDGRLKCFDCRNAALQEPSTLKFCGGCGNKRENNETSCSKCMRPF